MKLVDLLMNPGKAARRYSPLKEGLTDGQENELLFMYNRVREGEHRARIRDERTYASADPVIRDAYSRDAVSFPSDVDRLIKRMPGAVCLPRDRGELVELIRFAQDNGIPIVPRGGGTSVHGGAVPVEGGIVADLTGFDEVVEVDEEAGTVRVEPGVTWLDLEEELNAQGYSLPVMPDTAPSSTVGGAIAMDKAAFGAFGHGSIRDNLREVELLAPDLEIETLAGADLDLVVGCQGASGFILEAELDIVEAKDLVHVGAAFDTIDDAERFLGSLPTDGIDTVQILGASHVALVLEAKGEPRALPKRQDLVIVSLDADERERLVPDLEARCDTLDGDWIDEETAGWAHEHRFEHRCYQRFGPSLVVGKAVSPKSKLSEAWWGAMDAIEAPDYTLRAVATGPDEVTITAGILADERLPAYPLAFGSRMAFEDAVQDAGGWPKAPGLMTPGDAKPALGKDKVKRLRSWRSERDPDDIMNPGKVLPAKTKGLPILPTSAALVPGVAMLKSMRGQFDHRRGSTTEPSNRALRTVLGRRYSSRLAGLGDELYQCSRLGYTNRVGDLHRGISFLKEQPRTIIRAYRFDTQLPRGIVAAGRAILEGKEPTEQTVSHALSLPAVPTYENASQNGTPILEILEGVREASQNVAGLDPRVRDVVERLEDGNVLGEDPEARGEWMPGGAPSGVDTTTLFVAGDVGAYERDDAASVFNVFNNAGFGFTTLGPKEVHPGTVPYRLGAFDAAADSLQTFADRARDRMEDLPTTVVTTSSEDADVLRRRVDDLVEDSEHEGWSPRVLTATEVVASLVDAGRLTFQGGEDEAASDDADGDEDLEEDAEAADEDEQAAEDEDAAGDDEEATDDEDGEAEGDDAGFETLEVALVHSPFATDGERSALETIADNVPALEHEEVDLDDVLVPDLAYALVNPNQTDGLGMQLKQELAGKTAFVGCSDLAYVLDEVGVDVQQAHQVVAQRMEMREGGGVQLEVGAGEEEEEGFVEHDIPDDAHRIELVKEEAAIPVYPDESILDAAENFGYDLPFDCRAGSCVTCCARWEGEDPPDQSQAQAISEDEQETHVLTCVSKPTGDLKIWSGESP